MSHISTKGQTSLKVKQIEHMNYENFTDYDKRLVAWKFFNNLEVKYLIHTLLEKWMIIIKNSPYYAKTFYHLT